MWSIPISFVSLTFSSIKLFYSHRLGIYSDSDPPLKNLLLISPLIVLQNFGILTCWVFIAAYLKEFILICVIFVMAMSYVAVQTFIFKWNSKKRKADAISCKVPVTELEKEVKHCFWTAIFVSWISPCSVWFNTSQSNDSKSKAKTSPKPFLLVLSAGSISAATLCVSCIYVFLAVTTDNNRKFPITHCVNFTSNDSSKLTCAFERLNNSDIAINQTSCWYICEDNTCKSVERICLDGEQPTDLFFKIIGPSLFGLLFISLASSVGLQFLGNFHKLYKMSEKIPFINPIIHPSLLVDILDLKSADIRLDSLIDSASVDVVNYSDPNTGNTWLLNNLTDLIELSILIYGNLNLKC